MARMFRGRMSIKSSEVVGLFLFSLFGSMFVCLVFALLKDIFDYFFDPK